MDAERIGIEMVAESQRKWIVSATFEKLGAGGNGSAARKKKGGRREGLTGGVMCQ